MVENMGFGGNSEISEAVRAFNKSSIEDRKQQVLQHHIETSDTPKMVQIIIKYSGGLIKNEEQADYLIFALAIVALIISFHLFFNAGKPERENLIDIRKIDQSQFVR